MTHTMLRPASMCSETISASLPATFLCKSGYVRTGTGWFSDRSAHTWPRAGPVVLQETGFSAHLPCGEGLFAVRDMDEAADALDEVIGDYYRHAKGALTVARESLDARVVLGGFLDELGL